MLKAQNINSNSPSERLHFLQDFDAPIKNVFSFFSDHNRLGEIYPAFIRRIENAPNPTNCNDVGSKRIIIRLPLILQETITQYIEPNYLEYKITSKGIIKHHVGKMNFTALSPEKTRLEYIIEFKAVLPFTGFIIQQINAKIIQDALSTLALKFKRNPNY